MNIYYLMVKTHNVTGLKYLCQTKKLNPQKYKGSGTDWLVHIKEYGYDVTTEILLETPYLKEIEKWGRHYSHLWNVVSDNKWANRTIERAQGYPASTPDSQARRIATRRTNGNDKLTDAHKQAISRSNTGKVGKPISDARKEFLRQSNLGKKQSPESIAKQLATKKSRGTNIPSKQSNDKRSISMIGKNAGRVQSPEERAMRRVAMQALAVRRKAIKDGTIGDPN